MVKSRLLYGYVLEANVLGDIINMCVLLFVVICVDISILTASIKDDCLNG